MKVGDYVYHKTVRGAFGPIVLIEDGKVWVRSDTHGRTWSAPENWESREVDTASVADYYHAIVGE